MVRTRRSLVWADPTFERQREGIGERPQLADPCPMRSTEVVPKPSIAEGTLRAVLLRVTPDRYALRATCRPGDEDPCTITPFATA
jgi:hypothetical protein